MLLYCNSYVHWSCIIILMIMISASAIWHILWRIIFHFIFHTIVIVMYIHVKCQLAFTCFFHMVALYHIQVKLKAVFKMKLNMFFHIMLIVTHLFHITFHSIKIFTCTSHVFHMHFTWSLPVVIANNKFSIRPPLVYRLEKRVIQSRIVARAVIKVGNKGLRTSVRNQAL